MSHWEVFILGASIGALVVSVFAKVEVDAANKMADEAERIARGALPLGSDSGEKTHG